MTPGFVSVCIPAYAAETFIERTIACALGQTYPRLRVMISVDPSVDRTLDLCRSAASRDSRIVVVEQTDRLGWSQNVNAVLDMVDTEFAFVYFHDDIIEPTYVERLVETLISNPSAASAHCDLAEFGLSETVRTSHNYEGSSLERLADFLLTQRGTTLRSMLRVNALQPTVRFPKIMGDNRWPAYAFHLALLASGPALAVPEILYRRWQRTGSLTRSTSWQAETLDETIASMRAAVPCFLDIIETSLSSQDELIVARHCLRVFLAHDLIGEQLRLGSRTTYDVGRLFPVLGDARFLPSVLRTETEALLRDKEKQVEDMTELHERSNFG